MWDEVYACLKTIECSREEKRDQGPLALVLFAVEMSERSRREGLLALDDQMEASPVRFFRDLLRFVVDGCALDVIGRWGLVNLHASKARGVEVLNGLISLAAADSIAQGMSPVLLECMLTAFLGADADLYAQALSGGTGQAGGTLVSPFGMAAGGNNALCAQRLLAYRGGLSGDASEAFAFEDLVQLDDRSIQKVLRETDSSTLTKALKGTPQEVKDKISRNMSQRAWTLLSEDMAAMGAIRRMDAREAQDRIVSVVYGLVEAGEIIIARNADSEMVD